jgi:hypothetical protein
LAYDYKKKSFDCVEMKRRIQEQLRAEYESRKKAFASYVDFLNAKADQSPWVQNIRDKNKNKR